MKEKKLFILDTNVILHDYTCIRKFQEHDVMLLTTVLEELDKFKKGNDSRGYNVRTFHRELDELRKIRIKKNVGQGKVKTVKEVSALFNGGVSLGEDLGKIEIISSPRKLHPVVKEIFMEETPDHRILSKAFELQKTEEGKRKVILVTKDTNLRLKSEAIGLEVEDYENDKVPAIDILYTGRAEVHTEGIGLVIDELYAKGRVMVNDYPECFQDTPLRSNMYLVLKNGKSSCLARVEPNMLHLTRVEKRTVSGITPRNAEQVFSLHALLQPEIKLVTLLGKAGTGKTLLAIASAVHQLKEGRYDQIIIAAAMVPLSNKDIGALPGDANEKVIPYMQGLYDNLAFVQSQVRSKKPAADFEIEAPAEKVEKPKKSKKAASEESDKVDYISIIQKEGKLKIQPLASIRGRSFNNIEFIIDEGQNLTPHEVKTIITRAGENTKVVFCGDVQQIDSPYLSDRDNGLSHIVHRMGGQRIVAHVTLEKGERSELAELAADLL